MYRESTVSHCSQQNVLLFTAGLTPEYRKLLILYLEPAVKMSFPKNTSYSPLSVSFPEITGGIWAFKIAFIWREMVIYKINENQHNPSE